MRSLIIFYLVVIAVAVFGSQFPADAWYMGLQKSALTPPNIAFPIAWTILYALMPISIWMIYVKVGKTSAFKMPAYLFFLQLALNGMWTYLFFGLHRPDLALIDLMALWVSIVAMLISYARVSGKAALLQTPYFIWVSFAAFLNYQVWALN